MNKTKPTNHKNNMALKKELLSSNLAVELILHPSRTPDTKEVNEILFNGVELGAVAVENDVRGTLTALSVQHSKLTDRFTAWKKIKNMEDIKAIIPEKSLIRIYKSKPKTLEQIKSSLTVMDLTFEELKAFSAYGNQELLNFSDYLALYSPIASLLSRIPKLAIDIQDKTLSEKVLAELEEHKLDSNVYVIIERSINSFILTKKLIDQKGKDIQIGFSPPRELLKNEGTTAFKDCVRSSIINDGVKLLSININELPIIANVISKFKYENTNKNLSLLVYIPSENLNIDNILQLLTKNKAIKTLQIDN